MLRPGTLVKLALVPIAGSIVLLLWLDTRPTRRMVGAPYRPVGRVPSHLVQAESSPAEVRLLDLGHTVQSLRISMASLPRATSKPNPGVGTDSAGRFRVAH